MPELLTEPGGLALVDWALLALYAGATVGLGYYYSRKQSSTDEYFIGTGRMNPTLVGFSLFATLLSTISYLSIPGEAIGKGPIGFFGMLALPVVYLVVGYWMIPLYMRRRVTSIYELLEDRLGVGIRLLGATMFIALRLVWMSLLVYLAAVAMAVMLGVGPEMIPWIAGLTGFVAVVYTSLGGLRAGVITDLMQTLLMLGGGLLVIVLISYELQGFGWIPTAWHPNWDRQPLFTFDPGTRVSLFGMVLSSIVWYICTAGGDQTAVQRFMATGGAAAARRSLRTQLMVGATIGSILSLVGFALLEYFTIRADQLPVGISLSADADKVFPRFIAFHLPAGVSGLVVAAMFAAAMSSLDSGLNSISAVVTSDFLDRFRSRRLSEAERVRLAKLLAFGSGSAVVVGSTLIEGVPGNITAVTAKTTNLLVTPIFGLFFFAFFVPFARPAGVVVGAACGTITAALIAFSGPLFGMDPETGLDPVSFMWIGPAALLVNIITGCAAALILGRLARDYSDAGT